MLILHTAQAGLIAWARPLAGQIKHTAGKWLLACALVLLPGLSSPVWADTELTRQQLQKMIVKQAENLTFVDSSLALAVARVESNFYHVPRSSWGGIGALQINHRALYATMPHHAKSLSAAQSITLALSYLDRLIAAYEGELIPALRIYHGNRAVRGWPNSRVLKETDDYVANVLAARQAFLEQHAFDHAQPIYAGYSKTDNTQSSFVMQMDRQHSKPLPQHEQPILAFDSDWPEWKKQLYFAKNWLTDIAFMKSDMASKIGQEDNSPMPDFDLESDFVSKLDFKGNFTGSSRFVNDDDF